MQPFVQYLPTLDIDVGALCDIDPPEMPDISFSDLVALVQRDQAALAQSAGFKFAQLVHNILWYQYCKCSTGSTPAADPLPTPPAQLPTINPGSPTNYNPNPTTICRSDDFPGSPGTAIGNTAVTVLNDQWPGLLATAIRIYVQIQPFTSGPHTTSTLRIRFSTATTILQEFNIDIATSEFFDHTFVLPAGTVGFTVEARSLNASSKDFIYAGDQLYCGGTVGQLPDTSSCCPPDPILSAQLLSIQQQVDLIQRQLVPFAYITSASIDSLTGSGEFDVQGLLGLKISADIPPWLGSRAGTPTRFYDSGRVDIGTADGWQQSRYLDTAEVIWFPPGAGAMTRVGYSLEPGVTITITPLVREP